MNPFDELGPLDFDDRHIPDPAPKGSRQWWAEIGEYIRRAPVPSEPTTPKPFDFEVVKGRLDLHPLQYGYRNGEYVSDPGDDQTVVERYNRCPTCEQWSPCDFRLLVNEIERLQGRLIALVDARSARVEVGPSPEQIDAAAKAFGHYECDDCWYSCPLSPEGCCDEKQVGCTCGLLVRVRAALVAACSVRGAG